jgi:hypothetical protein
LQGDDVADVEAVDDVGVTGDRFAWPVGEATLGHLGRRADLGRFVADE